MLDQVVIGIETDRGPWMHVLVSSGYRVFAINPQQAARFRERHSTSGAKSDIGDAHALADMVRTDAHQLRQVAGDTDLAEAVKALARSHQNLIWDRTRQAQRLRTALRDAQLSQPAELTATYAAITRSLVALILSARVLAEFGDDPTRFATAKARKNYAGTSPITRQSGKKMTVQAWNVHNDRMVDALQRQAQGARTGSPGARAYYQLQRARGVNHHAALCQLANRLVGILHGCLKTGRCYDEATARPSSPTQVSSAPAG